MIAIKPYIKTAEEIEKIKIASEIVNKAISYAGKLLIPGTRADKINNKVNELIKDNNAESANLATNTFPYAICLSVWNEIAHAKPIHTKIIKDKSLVSIDVAVKKNGFFADGAMTFTIGDVHPKVKKLAISSYKALLEAISILKEGVLLSNYGAKVEELVRNEGLGIAKELTGHGIGKEYHEPPKILNFKNNENEIELKEGMVFAFELMTKLGNDEIEIDDKTGVIKSKDGNPAAHYEHTVLIRKDCAAILS